MPIVNSIATLFQSTKDSWDIVQIGGVVAIPIVLGVLGIIVNWSVGRRQHSLRYVELAIGVLQRDDAEHPSPALRRWATDELVKHSDVQFSSDAIAEMLRGGLPSRVDIRLRERVIALERMVLEMQGQMELPEIDPNAISNLPTTTELTSWLEGFEPGKVRFSAADGTPRWLVLSTNSPFTNVIYKIKQVLFTSIRGAECVDRGGNGWHRSTYRGSHRCVRTRFYVIAKCEFAMPLRMCAGLQGDTNIDFEGANFSIGYFRIDLTVVHEVSPRRVVDTDEARLTRLPDSYVENVLSAVDGDSAGESGPSR